MIVRSLVILAAAVAAVPASAFTPLEAAREAARLNRPFPSMIKIAPPPQTRLYATGERLPVYLNRHGGHYSCGDDDSSHNLSSVVCGSNASGNVGAFSLSDSRWADVMACVTDEFSQFNITVTDVEPASGDYVEAVVGGTPDQAGMPFGVGGVAPFTCGLIPNAIVYAFADVYGNDTQGICETVAQEVSHAFGLDHEFLCQDPMTYLTDCGPKTFQDQAASCGEYEPRQCSCGGASQNSVQSILQVIGASDGTVPPPPPEDTAPPTVSLVSPADGDILQSNSEITVSASASDDVGLTVVELQWDFTGESMFCPATIDQTGAYSCDQSGDTYTWHINVGEGSRTFRVHVRDPSGNDAITESRTIWLSDDGSGPPQDAGPPEVIIASPADGAVLPSNGPINVVAQIGDDSGLSRAELVWNGPNGLESFPCPSPAGQGAVGCVVAGSTYTWTLNVGSGSRTFSVRATDLVGNVTETDSRTISLQAGASVSDDNHENDNTIDTATVLRCGDSIDGVAADADWFAVDLPKGQRVTVDVEGAAKNNISLVATRGPAAGDVIDKTDNAVSLDGDGTNVKFGVLPANASAGDYTITVTCTAPKVNKPPQGLFGCAASGVPGAPAALLVALLGLGLRRRKR